VLTGAYRNVNTNIHANINTNIDADVNANYDADRHSDRPGHSAGGGAIRKRLAATQ